VRIRQQEILAELGVLALQARPFLELLNETSRLTAEGMEAEFCKVLEYLPAQNRLLVRAGVGWHEGIVGAAEQVVGFVQRDEALRVLGAPKIMDALSIPTSASPGA